MRFGKMIRAARLKKKLTVQQACKGIVTFGAWAMWERGDRRPDVDRLRQIARAVDLDIKELQEVFFSDSFNKAKRRQ